MAGKTTWTKEKIIKHYRETCAATGEIMTRKQIKEHNNLPCYQTIMKNFSCLNELRYKAGLISEKWLTEEEKENVKTGNEREELLCADCTENPEECGCDVEDCMEEAREYFDFIESHSIARRV